MRLRAARELVQRDSESFHEAAIVLEYIGQIRGRGIRDGLRKYEYDIVEIASAAPNFDNAAFRRQFHIVREARNDAVHGGAYVRHLSSRLVDLFITLEAAVMSELRRVDEVMVRNPVTAEAWHLIEHVRREMLANSFSNIPILWRPEGSRKWVFLTDGGIMRFLRNGVGSSRRGRLSMTVEIAMNSGLQTVPATTRDANTLIDEIATEVGDHPILVTTSAAGEERLVGIVSAFDLL